MSTVAKLKVDKIWLLMLDVSFMRRTFAAENYARKRKKNYFCGGKYFLRRI